MNTKKTLFVLFISCTALSVSCSTKFESKSLVNTNSRAGIDSEITPGGSEVVAPTETEFTLETEELSVAEQRLRLSNAFYNQVDNEINIQRTSGQTRPATLPLCENIEQLTSLFGCSMHSISGLRQTEVLTADVKVYLADPNQKTLDKVAFIVASHNFENPISINHEARYTSHPNGSQKIYDELALKGVSVVFIGFGYKDFYLNSIFDKSQATARAIQLINNLKINQRPSFLMGLSLGGVIGRMALNTLEETGENLHNVNHYVSFDSPHRGAHVPIGLQHIMQFLEDGGNEAKNAAESFQDKFGNLIDNILGLDDIANQLEAGIEGTNAFTSQVQLFSSVYLSSDFAQELVIQQINHIETGYTNSSYTRLQEHLNLKGMPKMTVANIGITNGSVTGTVLPITGNQYVSLDTNKRNSIELDFTSYIAHSGSDSIFTGAFAYPDPIELGGLFGGDGTDTFRYNKTHDDNIAHLDKSTCGYLNAVGDIEKVINAQLATMFNEKLNITNRLACFIPSTSGLATTEDIAYKGSISAQDSLFDEIIGGQENSHHLQFTPDISNGILDIVKRSY